MQITSLISIAALGRTETVKSQQASPAQSAASAQDTATIAVPSASSTAAQITGLSSNSRSKGMPGISTNQLNSMVQTSLKMQSIRNDAFIPEEVKKRLLAPLEQANKDTLNVVEVRVEQEEKEKIIEASSEDAEAIREAGEEIAASADAKDSSATESVEPVLLPSGDESVGAAAMANSPAQFGQTSAPVYSTSSPAPTVGANVDVQA